MKRNSVRGHDTHTEPPSDNGLTCKTKLLTCDTYMFKDMVKVMAEVSSRVRVRVGLVTVSGSW